MSKKENVSSIYEAPSLEEQPVRQFRLAEREGYQPANNKAQHLLEAVAGGHKPGESSAETRHRGMRRVVRTGAAALAAAAVTVGAAGGVKALEKYGEHSLNEQRQENIQPYLDYAKTGKVPKDDVVLHSGNYEGTAWDWAGQHASEGNLRLLSDRISDQADLQGDPGVQPHETYVVPKSELDQGTLSHLKNK